MNQMVKICVIGIWHLGLVTSACLAEMGYRVVGVDKDADRVSFLNRGVSPLFEHGIEDLLARNIDRGSLSYTTDLHLGAKGASYVFLAHDSPVGETDEVDVSETMAIARDLAACLENGSTVLVCSQVPVGTCETLAATIRKANPTLQFDIACCPENLRLGQAVARFMNPDMIVIGASSPEVQDKVERLFEGMKAPRLRMDLRSAEMTKHALNAFLATSISFINEVANLCDEVGADAVKVAAALRSDERIGPRAMLSPGLAFAGGTLARDLNVMCNLGKKSGVKTQLLDAVQQVNRNQNSVVIRKLERIYGNLEGLKIGVLGLTYKAGTSTLRRSAALEIIGHLTKKGSVVRAYDPHASRDEIRLHHEFEFCPNPYAVAKGSQALIVVTDWPEFKDLDFDLILSSMDRPVIIDGKNMLDSEDLKAKGFLYFGIGKGLA